MALFTISGSKQTFDDLQAQETKQQEDKIAYDTQLDTNEAELQHVKLVALDREKELSESQKVLNDKISFIRQYENDKKVSNEKLTHLKDKEASLSNQLSNDKANLIATQDQLKQIEEDRFNEEAALEQLQNQIGRAHV